MQFQIERRTPGGDNTNYVVIKIYYPLPNMIRVQNGAVTMPPILQTDSGLSRVLNHSKCGDNIYFYTNYTIHFVVTEDLNCFVRISLTDSIQLTTHFSMNISLFFNNTVQSSFLSNLCALLHINDMSRVNIVGVFSGSTIVTTTIGPDPSAPVTPGGDPTLASTATLLSSTISSGTFASTISTGVGYPVLGVSSTFSVLPTTSSSSSSDSSVSSSNVGLIVGVVVGAIVFLVSCVVLFFYCLRKRAKILEEIKNSEE